MIGRTLSHFKVTAKLGEGGMGEVYRAEDTTLGREVAIKVLPEAFAEDTPQRLARFEREAKLLASLNNSHIATVHGLEEVEDRRFLVMELVDGRTLAEKLSMGAIPARESLELARQIAEGLEAAHEANVVHRDLKPGNIMVGKDGKAKVLDFGLAKTLKTKAPEVDLDLSPTLTQPMTQAGHVLGTPVYMSPEQAQGKEAGKQSDIWAFGCVLYEMLTGKRAFPGGIVGDAGAEPDWEALPKTTPALARSLLRRCLEKDLRRRLHDIADARLEIEEAAAAPDWVESGLETALAPATVWERLRSAWWMLAAAVGIGALFAWMTWKLVGVPAGTPPTVVRLGLSMPPGVLMDATSLRPGVAISPDGRWVVFVGTEAGTRKLYKRSLDNFESTPIPGTDGARFAFFSPDGEWVGFWDYVDLQIEKVALDGGLPVVLCDAPNAWGATWGTNGKIVFSPGNLTGLWQVAEAGGQPELILGPSPEAGNATYILPEFLPDGRALLYTAWRGGFTAASAEIGVLDLASGETRLLIDNASSARYLPTGHLIFGRGGRAEVAPFDLESRAITGPSVPVPEPIFYDPGGKLHVAVSTTGTLAFVPGGRAPQRRLASVDLQGNRELLAGNPRGYEYARFSPDAQRLAASISEFGEVSVWILDRTTGLETRLAGEGRRNLPSWSPDGQRVAFSVETEQPPASWSIFWQQADASGPPEPLLMAREPGEWFWADSWSPDGEVLVLGRWLAGSSKDIFYVTLDDAEKLRPFLTTEADELNGLLSPDGRWIAYRSNETGDWAIYVQKFPEGGQRHQISPAGAWNLVGWSPDGRKIFYVFQNGMMEVGVTSAPRFQAETPRPLFEVRHAGGPWYYPEIQLSPDGQQFLMVEPDESWGVANEIKVVLNWLEELKQLAPTP